MSCDLAMSGIEVTKENKYPRFNVCASCMNTVVQTFNHFQEHIAQLRRDNADLQRKMKTFHKEHEKQKKIMYEEIVELEKKLAELKKNH
jgi:hypothetical protein